MINDIIAQITTAGGVARPSRFAVQIVPPNINSVLTLQQRQQIANLALLNGGVPQAFGNLPNYFKEMGLEGFDMPNRLDFMCMKAELPGKSFSVSDVRTYGAFFQMPYVDTYSNITLTFIVGKDMIERHFFDAWSYTIQDPSTSDFNYVNEYGTTMDVYQLDEFDQANYGIRFFQCWPITIGAMGLAYDERNSFHTLAITFTYRKWVNLRINSGTPTTIEPAGGAPAGFENTIVIKDNK
jgi:hypothetical protein